MTQAGKKKKSKSRKRHNSSWACTRLQPRPHTELRLPHPQARAPARPGPEWAARPSSGLDPADPSPGCAGRTPGKRAAEWVWPVGYPRRVLVARTAAWIAAPRRGERSAVLSPGPGELSMPVRRRPRVLLPLAPGRGAAKQRGHRPGRWRYSPMVAMAAAAATAQKCHLRSRGCMPGEPAAGMAAGLAPRGGRGLRWLRSGPPPPPRAPAPAGRCGMSRVARYIPGAPRLGPARPRRRLSAGPPANPQVQKSLRPAAVLHLRNAPKNKPLGAQQAWQSVTHASICQSRAAAGPWRYPLSHYQPITRRKPDTPAPPPRSLPTPSLSSAS